MKRPKSKQNDNKLLTSLKLISSILDNDGHSWQTHVLLQDNWISAHNGIIGIGEYIDETLYAAPNAIMLRNALAKCGDTISITQLETKLSVKSGKFRALVPCIPPENLTRAFPDPIQAQINNSLRSALEAVAPIPIDENRTVTASFLLYNGCAFSTDGKIILQAWHGLSLPTLVLPKSVLSPIAKCNKDLIGIGFSDTSCTFHFENNTWIKTQLFETPWPNVNHILNKEPILRTLPEGFYDAVNALEPFSEDGNIYFETNKMLTHSSDEKGASYEIYGLPNGPMFNIKQLKIVEPYMKKVDFMVEHHNSKMLYFQSDTVRGCIAGRAE